MTLFSGTKTVSPPACFGKSWDQHAAECAGGLDPAYTDSETGGHVRRPCGFFNECGSRCQAGKMQQARELIPATSLSRAWQKPTAQPPVTAPAPMQVGVQQFAIQQLQAQIEAMQKRAMIDAQRGGQPQASMYYQGPQPGFQQMMPVNFEMPQYLTQREYRRPNDGVFKVLGREVFRSMLKSAGHTFANFFDSTPFFEKPPRE